MKFTFPLITKPKVVKLKDDDVLCTIDQSGNITLAEPFRPQMTRVTVHDVDTREEAIEALKMLVDRWT